MGEGDVEIHFADNLGVPSLNFRVFAQRGQAPLGKPLNRIPSPT